MSEFQPTPTIEVIYSPFRNERHYLMVSETERQLAKAGSKIIQYWDSVVSLGVNILMEAEMTERPRFFEHEDIEGGKIRYLVRYRGVQIERFMQPVDLFLFTKPEVDENEAPSSIAVATYRGKNQRYVKLVGFTVGDQDGDVPQTHFHFFNGELVSLVQVVKPQILFQSNRHPTLPQFLSIQRLPNAQKQNSVLSLKAGYENDDQNSLHFYENFGGDLIKTQKLRVEDPISGQIDLIDVEDDGMVQTTSFFLAEAISNMANFEPATARD